jgi:outer membrane murein-binding lipoprotein Lpp
MKLLAISVALLLLTACETPFQKVARLETENQDLRARLAKQKEGLALQAKCAAAAKAYFNEAKASLGEFDSVKTWHNSGYENHYSVSLNKCFVMIYDDAYDEKIGDMSRSQWLSDVYENKEWASLFMSPHEGQMKLLTCIVDGVTCHEADEFERLIKPFMTN